MSTKPFGTHPHTNESLTLTTISSKPSGIIDVSFTNVGASIVSWKLGGLSTRKELVLGFNDGASYFSKDNPFFGATIGRIGNRIDHAKIKGLNGQDYQLTPNEGENVCHSGPEGFHHRIFEGPVISHEGNKQTVEYTSTVKHLEDKFPGTIKVSVKYHVEEEEHPGGVIAGKLGIEYQVDLLGDAEETAIAMTNHSYFNIGDGPTIAGTTIQLNSAIKQDVDKDKIPTGTTSVHPNLRLFTSAIPLAVTLGETSPVFDECFILPEMSEAQIDTRNLPVREFAHVFNEESRVNLSAASTEPTFQFYTGDGVNIPSSGEANGFGSRAGLCLEAGRPINAVNDPNARKWVVLKKGEVYGSYTSYTVWTST